MKWVSFNLVLEKGGGALKAILGEMESRVNSLIKEKEVGHTQEPRIGDKFVWLELRDI